MCRLDQLLFNSDRIDWFRKMVLSDSEFERRECLESILPLNQQNILEMFRIVKNRPISFRLLDTPLQDFLPCCEASDFRDKIEELCRRIGMDMVLCEKKVHDLQENSPMLGLRGCRLSIVRPEITEMEVRAILGEDGAETTRDFPCYFPVDLSFRLLVGAACMAHAEGILVQPEIVIPLAFSEHEIEQVVPLIRSTAAKVFNDAGFRLVYRVGCMLEVPRACVRSDKIAMVSGVDFVCFGTKCLTELVYGFCKDDSTDILVSH